MADQENNQPAQAPAEPQSESWLDKVKGLFSEAADLKFKRDMESASTEEASRMFARKQLDEGVPRLRELRTLYGRMTEGDLKTNEEAQKDLPAVTQAMSALAQELDHHDRVINPTFSDIQEKKLEQLTRVMQTVKDSPYTPLDQKKSAEQTLSVLEKFTSLDSQMKEAFLRQYGLPVKPEDADESSTSALEVATRNLSRLMWFSTNVLKGGIELAKGNTVQAISELMDAKAIATSDSSKFTEGEMGSWKEVATAAGITDKPAVSFTESGAKYLADLDKQIDEKMRERKILADSPDEPPIKKFKAHGMRGEVDGEYEYIYPKAEKDKSLAADIAYLRIKKAAAEISPAGALGVVGDIVADPLWLVKPLKAIEVTSKAGSKVTAKVVEVAEEFEKAIPNAIKNTTTYKNSVTRAKELIKSEAIPIMAGERPISSAPIVRHVAKMLDITADIPEASTTTSKAKIEDLVRDLVGTDQTLHKEAFLNLTPILKKLEPVLKNPQLKEEAAYALAAMQDNSHALMVDYASLVGTAQNAFKRKFIEQGFKASAAELDDKAFGMIDGLFKKHGGNLDAIESAIKEFASPLDEVAYLAGEKIPKDVYLWTKDRIPTSVWDEVMNKSIEGLGKGHAGVDAVKVQEGVRELLNNYRSLGVENERLEIIKSMLPNYSPRQWEAIQQEGVPAYLTVQRYSKPANPWFTKHRKFATYAEAQKAYAEKGMQLNKNFDDLAAQYSQISARKQAQETFVRSIEDSLNVKREGFSPELQNMIEYVTNGPDRTKAAQMWRKYYLDTFKVSQLYGFPAYHVRNILDNYTRTFITSGTEGLKLRNNFRALRVLGEDAKTTVKFGSETKNGAELYEKAFRLGVIRNDVVRLDRSQSARQLLRHYSNSVVNKASKFVPITPQFAQMADNASRMNMWLVETEKLVKGGMNFDEAAVKARNTVSKAHMGSELAGPAIDALSNFIPFIKFQSGSWAYYGRALLENPARVGTLYKLLNNPTANQLSADEKEALSPFVKENLRILISKDPSGTQNYLSSFGLSIENINQLFAFTGPEGKFDVSRTLEKGIAQTTMLNALYGLAAQRDPFTGAEYDSYRFRTTNKFLYENEFLNKMVGGIVKHPDGKVRAGEPHFRYEIQNPKQYVFVTQILQPLVNSGLMGALSGVVGNQNLTAVLGALGSTRMTSTLGAMSNEDQGKAEKALRLLTGAKIITEETTVAEFRSALSKFYKAKEDLDKEHDRIMSYEQMSDNPEVQDAKQDYIKRKQAK